MVSSASGASASRSVCGIERLSNDRSIAGVGLGFAGVQIGDAAHGQPWQIGDQDAFIAGDCHGQCADGSGLIDDEQELAVFLEFVDEGTQFGLIVGQRFIEQALPVPVERDGMMLAFADIDADEDIDGVMLLVFLHRNVCGMNGLNDLFFALSVGLPRTREDDFHTLSFAHVSSAFEINSLPLSALMCRGSSVSCASRVNAATTSLNRRRLA